MKEARLQPDAPAWMIRMRVAEDLPVSAPGRLGRQRRRVDIVFGRSQRGLCFTFPMKPNISTGVIPCPSTLGRKG